MLRLKRFFCLCCLKLTLFSIQAYGAIALSNIPSPAEIDYNLRIGTLQFNLAANTQFEWDSNFNLSSSNEEASFSITPSMYIQAYIPISPYLVFSTGTNIGYQYYLKGDGIDGLTIGGLDENATSSLNGEFRLSNDSIIFFSNTISSYITSASFQTDDRQRQEQPFREFNSTSSLGYAKRLTPYTRFNSRYSFENIFTRGTTTGNTTTDTTSSNLLDRQVHEFSSEINTQLNESLTIGLNGSASMAIYAEEFRNNFMEYRLTPSITYVSKTGLTRASLSLPVNNLIFDNTNSSTTQDNKRTGLNLEGSFNVIQGNFLTHSLVLRRELTSSNATTFNPANPGEIIPVNYQEETSLNYAFNYVLHRRLSIRLSYGFSRVKESDGGNPYFRETISARIPFQLQLNTRTTVSADYTYSQNSNSRFDESNYDRHLIQITCRFDF